MADDRLPIGAVPRDIMAANLQLGVRVNEVTVKVNIVIDTNSPPTTDAPHHSQSIKAQKK